MLAIKGSRKVALSREDKLKGKLTSSKSIY